jgi:hypothetical protein
MRYFVSIRITSCYQILRGQCIDKVITDLYTAGTILLAVLVSSNFESLETDITKDLDASWAQCLECLSRYDDTGSSFARQCQRLLQTVYERNRHMRSQLYGKWLDASCCSWKVDILIWVCLWLCQIQTFRVKYIHLFERDRAFFRFHLSVEMHICNNQMEG